MVLGQGALGAPHFTADLTCMHGRSLGHIVRGAWLLLAARGALGPCWWSRPVMTSQLRVEPVQMSTDSPLVPTPHSDGKANSQNKSPHFIPKNHNTSITSGLAS